MDKKTTGMIATIATAILCGCPGLVGLCLGGTSVLASFIPGAEIDVFGSSDPGAATTMGFVFLCLSVIFIAIPIVVGVVTLRRRPDVVAPVVPPVSGPMPPTVPDEDQRVPPAPPEDEEPLPPAS